MYKLQSEFALEVEYKEIIEAVKKLFGYSYCLVISSTIKGNYVTLQWSKYNIFG